MLGVSTEVITGGPHTCRFGSPFLRGIFMVMHQLCCVSDVRRDCLLAPK